MRVGTRNPSCTPRAPPCAQGNHHDYGEIVADLHSLLDDVEAVKDARVAPSHQSMMRSRRPCAACRVRFSTKSAGINPRTYHREAVVRGAHVDSRFVSMASLRSGGSSHHAESRMFSPWFSPARHNNLAFFPAIA
jgi:hypothetical protein